MGVTVAVNGRSVVHESSNGITTAFPDVCKTPAPPVPVPYPNVARSSDTASGSKKVKCDGNSTCVRTSNFSISTGDEPGSLLGVVSNKVKGKAEFVNFSFDVKFEGKNVTRAYDIMLHNDKNTPPFPVIQGPAVPLPSSERPICYICKKAF